MFKSAIIKLTLWYLAMIFALSLLFSAAFYTIATRQLSTSLIQHNLRLHDELDEASAQKLDNSIEPELEAASHKLLVNLIIVNLVTLVGLGAASYLLAKKTLQPIEDAHEKQKRFTADASHELRTPLAAMQLEIETTVRNRQANLSDYKKLAASNLEEVNRLAALTQYLLQLSRSMESAGILIKKCNMKDITSRTINRHLVMAKAKDVTITSKLSPVHVSGNQENLEQVIGIVLDNAIKYSRPGGRVKLTLLRDGAQVVVKVKDQGIGIPADQLPKVFDRFYRVDAARTKQASAGFGLGLALAKEIVTAHHGTITLTSQPGQGTTVTIMLPIARA